MVLTSQYRYLQYHSVTTSEEVTSFELTSHSEHLPTCHTGMDAAHSALVRARATEDALATLRAELRELESGDTLRAPKFEGALGTSIDDLARLHEGHASNMREFSRMLRDSREAPPPTCAYAGASSSISAPLPSDEPNMELMGRRMPMGSAGPSAPLAASASELPRRPDFARPLLAGADAQPSSSLSNSADLSARRPVSTSHDAVPMQRSSTATREAASSARARAEAASAARFAAEAAVRREAAARHDAFRSRLAARDAQALGNESASAEGAVATVGEGMGGGGGAETRLRASSSGATLPIRMPRPRPSSAPRERRSITVPRSASLCLLTRHRPLLPCLIFFLPSPLTSPPMGGTLAHPSSTIPPHVPGTDAILVRASAKA